MNGWLGCRHWVPYYGQLNEVLFLFWNVHFVCWFHRAKCVFYVIKTWISGSHLARAISSDVSKSTGDDEDVKVKDGDLDAEDDDDSARLPSSGKSTKEKSDRKLLWEKLDKHKKEGEMISELQLFISGGQTFTNDDAAFVISKLRRYGRFAQAAEVWIQFEVSLGLCAD